MHKCIYLDKCVYDIQKYIYIYIIYIYTYLCVQIYIYIHIYIVVYMMCYTINVQGHAKGYTSMVHKWYNIYLYLSRGSRLVGCVRSVFLRSDFFLVCFFPGLSAPFVLNVFGNMHVWVFALFSCCWSPCSFLQPRTIHLDVSDTV